MYSCAARASDPVSNWSRSDSSSTCPAPTAIPAVTSSMITMTTLLWSISASASRSGKFVTSDHSDHSTQ
jgi:hypothetical protein